MNSERITRITLEQAKQMEGKTDWERLDSMSNDEIEQNALDDPDNQPLKEDFLRNQSAIRRDRSHD